jgi:hypothetical protein
VAHYGIKARAGEHLVYNVETGAVESAHRSRKAAIERISDLGREEKEQQLGDRQQAEHDPVVQAGRAAKHAYRLVERDPLLRTLKEFLPRKGQVERTTRLAYERTLMRLDPRSPGQRRVARASKTAQRVHALWEGMPNVPERSRARRIADKLELDPAHVRRLLRGHRG